MNRVNRRRPRNRVHVSEYLRQHMRPLIIGSVVAGLAIALIAVSISRSSLSAHIDYSKESLTMTVESNIRQVIRNYDQMSVAGADIEGTIVPEMQLCLHTANTMNNLLIEVYGEGQAVLEKETFEQMQQSLNQLVHALERGQVIADAQAGMGAVIERVQFALAERYGSDDALMPRTAST